ncbi:MAG: sigma-54-dependent Fis family transcriptional regulator [Spirochaetaceae bacterium]|nr:MAG: sigma-54-dependent Fis family transcriptional regulator [Spirochaetaceae bacterium]
MKNTPVPTNPILIVDDEAEVIQVLTAQLRSNGINNLIGCQDSREVMHHLRERDVEVVLLDLSMPHLSGQLLLEQIHEQFPYIPVIIITASNEVQTAVECMKAGAFDYMVKAIEESRLLSGVRRAIEIRELKREYGELRSRFLTGELADPSAFSRIITRNNKMKSIFLYIEAVAHTADPVLITGETGVGKDLIAQVIHEVSGRAGEFVAVNAAGREEDKLSDDLFGHVRGAFTGADTAREGLIQRARGGTLFLDEIGDLSSGAQIKLLKFLDTGEYYPLGSDLPKRSDARVVLATNRDLERLIADILFRKDLYYRVSTHQVHVPPLRERTEDLPLLLEHFTKTAADEYGKEALRVPAELVTLLSNYPFAGNIRELQKLVKNAAALAKPSSSSLPIQPFLEAIRQHAPQGTVGPQGLIAARTESLLEFKDILPTVEQARELLTDEALGRTRGNISEAARLLGISHQALSKWLQRRKSEQSRAGSHS